MCPSCWMSFPFWIVLFIVFCLLWILSKCKVKWATRLLVKIIAVKNEIKKHIKEAIKKKGGAK